MADLFRVSTQTVGRWVSRGALQPFRTLGGHRRFYAAEVQELASRAEAVDAGRPT